MSSKIHIMERVKINPNINIETYKMVGKDNNRMNRNRNHKNQKTNNKMRMIGENQSQNNYQIIKYKLKNIRPTTKI